MQAIAFSMGFLVFMIFLGEKFFESRGKFKTFDSFYHAQCQAWSIGVSLFGIVYCLGFLRTFLAFLEGPNDNFYLEGMGWIVAFSLSVWSLLSLIFTTSAQWVFSKVFIKKWDQKQTLDDKKKKIFQFESFLYLFILWGSLFSLIVQISLSEQNHPNFSIVFWGTAAGFNFWLLKPKKKISSEVIQENADQLAA